MWARYCTKHLTFIPAFDPQNNPTRWVPLSSPRKLDLAKNLAEQESNLHYSGCMGKSLALGGQGASPQYTGSRDWVAMGRGSFTKLGEWKCS